MRVGHLSSLTFWRWRTRKGDRSIGIGRSYRLRRYTEATAAGMSHTGHHDRFEPTRVHVRVPGA
jgi:hypothetical protein